MKTGTAQVARLALAESMELLDRAVSEASARLQKARAEVEAAEAQWSHWNSRRHSFKQSIREATP